ncbi:GtrA family protein [Mesorhizobium sp. M0152]|uniref:GtrA family protein n=1 Tax=Mesorhizobium sp. M0152 TaxID=2956898 RepID=UPI00333CC114
MQRIARFFLAGGRRFRGRCRSAPGCCWRSRRPLVARILSIGFALCSTWQINRQLTFAPSRHRMAQEGARYGGVGVATNIVNYLVYSATLLAMPALPRLAAFAVASPVA